MNVDERGLLCDAAELELVAREEGARLLTALRLGSDLTYARPLPALPEAPPAAMQAFSDRLAVTEVANALSTLLSPTPLVGPVPDALLPYASGPVDKRWAPEPTVRSYLTSLFHHISDHGGRALCGWDLFHAHLFIDRTNDVGLLFHAAEFPAEYTLSSRAVHPIGSAASGGKRDPRTGTALSVRSTGFAERNFLYLASTSRIYMLLPQDPGFPTGLLSPYAAYHFATVSEAAFCHVSAIADVNYFPEPTRPVRCSRLEPVRTATAQTPLPPSRSHSTGLAPKALASSRFAPSELWVAVYAPHAAQLNAPPRRLPTGGDCLPAPAPGPAPPPAGGTDAGEVRMDECRAAVVAARVRQCQVEVSLRFDRMLAGKPAAGTGKAGGLWVVLVGGEFGGCMLQDPKKTRPGAWLGSHTSLQAIGRAYASLAPVVGRGRIIVIAQLRETLTWLEEATQSEEACERVTGHARFLDVLRGRLAETLRDCALLLASGGAQYDGGDVNTATVLRVLQGEPDRATGAAGSAGSAGDVRPVLPRTATSVLLMLNSHGNAHPRHPDKVDQGLDVRV